MTECLYSRIADEQLDLIEAADPDLYEGVQEACQLVLEEPARAQALSTAIATGDPRAAGGRVLALQGVLERRGAAR